MLPGLNLAETAALAAHTSLPVIASGGLKNLADITALKAEAQKTKNLSGAILGRALYDGGIDPKSALAAC